MTAQPNPYAPPKAEVSDASETEVVELASRLRRLGAALLDSLTGFLASLPLLIVIMPGLMAAVSNPSAAPELLLSSITGGAAALTGLLMIVLLIVTIVLVKRHQQTIGKRLVGIRVARADGSRTTLGRIFWLRNVVNVLPSFIPFVGGLYGLIDVLFIFGEKRQCIHDKIADTIVINA